MTAPPRADRGARALGYRLLGRRLDYLLHLRPAEWPIMAGHTLLGTVLALGLPAVLRGEGLAGWAVGLVLWVACLNGGTLAINSAFDRDEGDVAYLRAPPPPPRRLFAFGLGLMVAGQVAALALPVTYATLYAACLGMSVLYSVPPFRLKARAGLDWVINLAGFGTLTPLAGWAATGRPVTTPGLLLALGFGALFAALYPLTQLYQFDEDRRRGDRTFALVLGMRRSLSVALAATLVAFALFGAAAAVAGWLPAHRWRIAALGAALLAWGGVLVPWRLRWAGMTPDQHQRGMHLALGAWAVTDLAVVLGWGW